jgi:hypothetical protein
MRVKSNTFGNTPLRWGTSKRKSFRRSNVGSSLIFKSYGSGGQGIRTLNRFLGT